MKVFVEIHKATREEITKSKQLSVNVFLGTKWRCKSHVGRKQGDAKATWAGNRATQKPLGPETG
jgi:hypothetical protein